MGNLTMAIGTLDGVVLAADARFEAVGEVSPNIYQIGDAYAALVEPSVQDGVRILEATLAAEPDEGFQQLQEIVATSRQIGREVAEAEDRPVVTGLIFCGLDQGPESPAFPQVYGVHSSRQFEPRAFIQNAFGGAHHSIARYLADRLTRQRPTTGVAKHFAALALLGTRGVLGPRLEPYAAFATITASDGFSWVERDEVHAIMQRTNLMLSRLPTQLNEMFLGESSGAPGGVYQPGRV